MEKVPFEGETMDQPNRKNIRYDLVGSVIRKSDPNAVVKSVFGVLVQIFGPVRF